MLQESINIPRSACTIALALLAKYARAHIKYAAAVCACMCICQFLGIAWKMICFTHSAGSARNTRNWAKRYSMNLKRIERFSLRQGGGGRGGDSATVPFSWCRAIAIRSRDWRTIVSHFSCVLLLAHIFDDRSFMRWRAWFVGNAVSGNAWIGIKW